jgi:hypothetical protein
MVADLKSNLKFNYEIVLFLNWDEVDLWDDYLIKKIAVN